MIGTLANQIKEINLKIELMFSGWNISKINERESI